MIDREISRALMHQRLREVGLDEAWDEVEVDDLPDTSDALLTWYDDPLPEIIRKRNARGRMKYEALVGRERLFEQLRRSSLQDVQELGVKIEHLFHPLRRYRRRVRNQL